MRAEEEAKYFANEACSDEYQIRYQRAKARYEEAKKVWHKTQIDKTTAQQNELRCDYVRSRFGNDKTIKSFLFHLSSVCLNPENFHSLSFSINGLTGDISYGINAKNPETGNVELRWFPNVYEDIFRYFPPDAPFHAYFAARGRYIANEISYLGGIACFPNLLDASEANFQKSTRKNAGQEVAMVISLKAMARFAILKSKHFSVCRKAARLTHGMDGNEYSQTVFYPTLSQYASHIQLITRNGQYVCFQDINDIHANKPDDPIVKQMPTTSNLPLSLEEQHSSPDSPKREENPEIDGEGKGKSRGKGKAKGKGKGRQTRKTTVKQEQPSNLTNDQPSVLTNDQPISIRSHPRKQTIVARNFDDNPEDQLMLAHIHNLRPELSFYGNNAKFWQSLKKLPPPALQLPPISIKNGTFQNFVTEWKKTESMPPRQQVFFRRHLTKFFQPCIQTDTLFEPTLFRFCAFSLYDF